MDKIIILDKYRNRKKKPYDNKEKLSDARYLLEKIRQWLDQPGGYA